MRVKTLKLMLFLCVAFLPIDCLSGEQINETLFYVQIKGFQSGSSVEISSSKDFRILAEKLGENIVFVLLPEIEEGTSPEGKFVIFFQGTALYLSNRGYVSLADFEQGIEAGFESGVDFYAAQQFGIEDPENHSYFKKENFFTVEDMRAAIESGFKNAATRGFLPLPRTLSRDDFRRYLGRSLLYSLLRRGSKVPVWIELEERFLFEEIDRFVEKDERGNYFIRDDLSSLDKGIMIDFLLSDTVVYNQLTSHYQELEYGLLSLDLSLPIVIDESDLADFSASERRTLERAYDLSGVGGFLSENEENLSIEEPVLYEKLRSLLKEKGIIVDTYHHLIQELADEGISEPDSLLKDSHFFYVARAMGYRTFDEFEPFIDAVAAGFESINTYRQAKEEGYDTKLDFSYSLQREIELQQSEQISGVFDPDPQRAYSRYRSLKSDLDIYKEFYELDSYKDTYFYLYLSQLASRREISASELLREIKTSFRSYDFSYQEEAVQNYLDFLDPDIRRLSLSDVQTLLENEAITSTIGEYSRRNDLFKKY